MRKYILYVFVLPLILIGACSGSSGDDALNKIPIKAIKEKVNSNSSSIETLEAYGVISFDSPDNSGTGNIEIKIRKPDSVYVKIEGPFGISIAAALITRQDFIYYNIQENKVITGPSTDLNIGAILRIRVSFDELINSFTGSFHFKDDSSDSTEAASESSMYVLQVNGAKGIEKYFVEPSFYTIQQYKLLDKDMKSKIEVAYSNYTNENTGGKSVSFPNKVVIKNIEKQQSVYLDYETKEINKKDIKFKLKFPKSAKVIKWD